MNLHRHYLDTAITTFQSMKALGDKTFEQLTYEELHHTPTSESNSIAIIVKHLNGNMFSRWQDLFGSDGEKGNRDRDVEFEGGYVSKEELLTAWEAGWNLVFHTLQSLLDEDLERTTKIRGEEHSILQAIQRQITHYSNHIGQIVYIGKMIKNDEWTTLSIPKGQSAQYNKAKFNEQSK